MSASDQPTKADLGKTKRQLIDELNSLRLRLGESEPTVSRVDNEPISDSLQIELGNIKSEASLLYSIVDVSADAIISIDDDQCITRFNQGAEQIFGYSAAEAIGKSLEILLPDRFKQHHRQLVQGFRQTAGPSRQMNQQRPVQGLRKDSTQFPAAASISRIEQAGRTTLTVHLRDLTEITRTQEAAQRSSEQLAHVTRTGMLGEIAASLAHEINQPLAAILTNAQVLRRRLATDPTCPEDAKEAILDVIDDSRRAGEVILRLRALTEPGERMSEFIDINQIITDVAALLNSEVIMRQCELTMELAPELGTVLGDRIQLQQILLNLMTNALDAMDSVAPADRHLLVRTHCTKSDAVEICVKDSGVGLKDKSCEQLLEPFYTTKESGMGMGLAITRTIVQAHGGRLSAENNKGPGASFYFALPVADATASIAARGQEQEQEQEQEQLVVTTVFIVDDDASFRKAMERLIRSAGYAVETFASAQEFLRRKHYVGYGCVVADLHMPGESGLDLQSKLNARNYHMPIIFITGAGDTASGVRAMKLGALDFLAKPVDDEALLKVIARAVEIDIQARAQNTQHAAAKEKMARLTVREIEVLTLVVNGARNKQIAHRLGISEKTVKAHRGRVMQKVEAKSVTDLVRISELGAETPKPA